MNSLKNLLPLAVLILAIGTIIIGISTIKNSNQLQKEFIPPTEDFAVQIDEREAIGENGQDGFKFRVRLTKGVSIMNTLKATTIQGFEYQGFDGVIFIEQAAPNHTGDNFGQIQEFRKFPREDDATKYEGTGRTYNFAIIDISNGSWRIAGIKQIQDPRQP
jgi:hypothetical protein